MNTKRKIYARQGFEESRLKRGMSLRGIAKSTGLTPSVLSKVERGQAVMPRTARKICIALECDFDTLFMLEGDE